MVLQMHDSLDISTLDILLNIVLNMFSLDSFMSCLHSLLGYPTGEFQALQLIILVAFGAVG